MLGVASGDKIAVMAATDSTHVGPALARLRKRAGLRQADVAARLGVHVSNVSRIEQPGSNPGIDMVFKVVGAIGASFEDLSREILRIDPVQAALETDDRRLEDEPEHRRATLDDLNRLGPVPELEEIKRRLERLEAAAGLSADEEPVPNGAED